MTSSDDLRAAKAAARRLARVRRTAAKDGAGGDAAERALALLRRSVPLPAPATVVGYWPMDEEFNVVPMLEFFHAEGWTCGLPCVMGAGKPLVFRRWQKGDALRPAGFGTVEPEAESPEVDPALLLVPLLAFDAAGYRLGYGGGFYDRTLEALRARRAVMAVGVAFDGQAAEDVPHGQRDQRLDWVVTERRAIRFSEAGGRGAGA